MAARGRHTRVHQVARRHFEPPSGKYLLGEGGLQTPLVPPGLGRDDGRGAGRCRAPPPTSQRVSLPDPDAMTPASRAPGEVDAEPPADAASSLSALYMTTNLETWEAKSLVRPDQDDISGARTLPPALLATPSTSSAASPTPPPGRLASDASPGWDLSPPRCEADEGCPPGYPVRGAGRYLRRFGPW